MDEPLRLLLIDDHPGDRARVRDEVRSLVPDAQVHEVDGAVAFEEALRGGEWDVAITDHALAWSSGLDVFQRLRKYDHRLPVIMFTPSGDETAAVSAMRQGLDDCFSKLPRHFARLPFAVRAWGERTRQQRLMDDALEARRLADARLQIAFKAARIGTWELDISLGTVSYSDQLAAMLGRESGYLARSLAAALEDVHPGDRPLLRSRLEVLLRGEEARALEFRLVTRGGATRWVAGYGKAFRDAARRVTHVIGVVIDITERKALEEGLREADRQKDEFLATLAHELRNPLAPIRYAADALRPGISDALLRQVRGMVERQVAQMARLLDDLLDVSRITRNVVELRRERVDLAAVVAEVVEAARPAITDGGYAFSLSLPASPVWVEGDRARLQQVTDNLLQNALKYTPAGGRIEIEVATGDERAVLRVRDSGIGLAPDMLPRMFRLFSQVHASPSSPPTGLGIGLAVVKRLVELHGGAVSVASDGLGQGALFTVQLPLSDAPGLAERPQSRRHGHAGLARPHVLIADDHADIVDSVALLLQLDGYRVSTAVDGEEAIVAAERDRPDVMVLDIGMPRRDGYEVARWVREQPWGDRVRLVAVTGWGQDVDRERSRAAGFDAHLVKPVEPRLLQETIDRLARGMRSSG
jgi:two-component system CheB/CheR fusion protein